MKKTLLIVVAMLGLAHILKGQDYIEYIYDDAGNRTERHVITFSLSSENQKSVISPAEEKLGESSIKIYPNPTSRTLLVSVLGGDENDIYSYTLHSLEGTLLLQGKLEQKVSNPINLSSYTSGMYILSISNGKKKTTYRIVKE